MEEDYEKKEQKKRHTFAQGLGPGLVAEAGLEVAVGLEVEGLAFGLAAAGAGVSFFSFLRPGGTN